MTGRSSLWHGRGLLRIMNLIAVFLVSVNQIEEWALYRIRSHGTKSAMLRRKLRTGNPKQSDLNHSFFVLDAPVRSLRPNMADFVLCDPILQNGLLKRNSL